MLYYSLLILFYIYLCLYYIFIYWPLYLLFLTYWSLRIIYYVLVNEDREVTPHKIPMTGYIYKQYFLMMFILRPYVFAFYTCYSILKFKLQRNEKIEIRFDLIIKILKNVIIRLTTGLSTKLLKKAKHMSIKLINSRYMIVETATTDKSYNHIICHWLFNLVVDSLPETNRLEKRRIYKNEDSIWNFNPDREKIISLFNKIFPKVELILPNTSTEKKLSALMVDYSINSEVDKLYFSIKGSKDHYGALYREVVKDKNILFGTNFTSKKITCNKKNFEIAENSYLLPPYYVDKKIITLDSDKIVIDDSDKRLIADEFYLQEIFTLSSIYFNNFKVLSFDENNNSLTLKNSEKLNFLKNSLLDDLDNELANIKSSLKTKLWIDHETLFKFSISEILEKPEIFDLLEYWSNK